MPGINPPTLHHGELQMVRVSNSPARRLKEQSDQFQARITCRHVLHIPESKQFVGVDRHYYSPMWASLN